MDHDIILMDYLSVTVYVACNKINYIHIVVCVIYVIKG